eukprot:467187-Prymnesium_polylepis.1
MADLDSSRRGLSDAPQRKLRLQATCTKAILPARGKDGAHIWTSRHVSPDQSVRHKQDTCMRDGHRDRTDAHCARARTN